MASNALANPDIIQHILIITNDVDSIVPLYMSSKACKNILDAPRMLVLIKSIIKRKGNTLSEIITAYDQHDISLRSRRYKPLYICCMMAVIQDRIDLFQHYMGMYPPDRAPIETMLEQAHLYKRTHILDWMHQAYHTDKHLLVSPLAIQHITASDAQLIAKYEANSISITTLLWNGDDEAHRYVWNHYTRASTNELDTLEFIIIHGNGNCKWMEPLIPLGELDKILPQVFDYVMTQGKRKLAAQIWNRDQTWKHSTLTTWHCFIAALNNGFIDYAKSIYQKQQFPLQDLENTDQLYAASQYPEITEFLLQIGYTDYTRLLANMLDTSSIYMNMITRLLELGATVTSEVMIRAMSCDDFKLIELLVAHGGILTDDHVEFSLQFGNIDILKLLIAHVPFSDAQLLSIFTYISSANVSKYSITEVDYKSKANSHLECIKYIFSKINLRLVNWNQLCALATGSNRSDILLYLIEQASAHGYPIDYDRIFQKTREYRWNMDIIELCLNQGVRLHPSLLHDIYDTRPKYVCDLIRKYHEL